MVFLDRIMGNYLECNIVKKSYEVKDKEYQKLLEL